MGPKPKMRYSQDQLASAIEAVKNGMKIYKAALMFNIPKSTLHDKINHKYQDGAKPGHGTYLTQQEEELLVNWIMKGNKRGGPPSTKDILNTVQNFILATPERKTPFKNGRPGSTWLKCFLKRHQNHLSIRVPERVSKTRAAATQTSVHEWFKDLNNKLEEDGAQDIMLDLSPTLNCDETNIQIYKMEEDHNSEQLFCAELLVAVSSDKNPLSSRTQTRKLTILLQLRGPPGSTREVYVRVTEENNPMLLYTSVVTETDYQTLRKNQGLLVDFTAFPYKFVELIKTCIAEENQVNPRFKMILRSDDNEDFQNVGSESRVILEVAELNPFKHLCHLALVLSPSNNNMKLQYLVTCMNKLKAQNQHLEKDFRAKEYNINKELKHCAEKLSQKSHEIEQLKTEFHNRNLTFADKQAHLLAQEKEKVMKIQSDADRRIDREKRELEARFINKTSRLEETIHTLKQQNNELLMQKNRAEGMLTDIQGRNTTRDHDLIQLNQEVSHLKISNNQLNEELNVARSSLQSVKTDNARLDEQLNNKTEAINQFKKLFSLLEQQKIATDRENEELRQKIERRENACKNTYNDLQKSLEILRRFESEKKDLKANIHSKSEIINKCNQEIMELKTHNKDLSEDFKISSQKYDDYSKENATLKEQLNSCNNKLAEQETTIRSNQSMIAWLNKQLNEAESFGIKKKAPLVEAYLSSSQPGKYENSSASSKPNAASTPLTSTSGPVLSSSLRSMKTPLSTLKSLSQIPPITEEFIDDVSDRENIKGLDPKYLENSKSSDKNMGLRRDSPEGILKAPARGRGTARRARGRLGDGIVRRIQSGT